MCEILGVRTGFPASVGALAATDDGAREWRRFVNPSVDKVNKGRLEGFVHSITPYSQ